MALNLATQTEMPGEAGQNGTQAAAPVRRPAAAREVASCSLNWRF